MPTELGQLTDMTGGISIWANSLTGPLPTQLGNLVLKQEDFLLYSNKLSGSIPTQVPFKCSTLPPRARPAPPSWSMDTRYPYCCPRACKALMSPTTHPHPVHRHHYSAGSARGDDE